MLFFNNAATWLTMKLVTRAVKGTHDLFGDEIRFQRKILRNARQWLESAGAFELATPVFEFTEVFQRGVGQTTDIVQKEMYTFSDRAGRSITLRPEGTAGVIRAFIEHGMKVMPQPVRIWYAGPMFRAERPQKGRQRQFHQVGYEIIGSDSYVADAEAILLSYKILESLGLRQMRLRIGSVGDSQDRMKYNEYLNSVLTPHFDDLSTDSQRRLVSNPLRILDSKAPQDIALLQELDVKPLLEFMGEKSRKHFESVKKALEDLGIAYTIDSRIVRGLDYYAHTAWEIHHELLGSQSALGGGGRYDTLVETLGGAPSPGVGWALGLERVTLAMQAEGLSPDAASRPLIYIFPLAAEFAEKALLAAQSFWPQVSAQYSLSAKKPAKGLREAEKRGAKYAGIIGQDEAASEAITIKNLHTKEQKLLSLKDAAALLKGENNEAH